MPQSETVILDARDQTASATKSANANMASVENSSRKASDAANKAVNDAGQSQVVITDRSRKQIDAIVSQTERRLLALKSPLERLSSQKEATLARVAGDPVAVRKVTAAFGELMEAEKKHNELAERIGQAIEHPLQTAGSVVKEFVQKFGLIGAVATGLTIGLAAAGAETFHFIETQGKAAEAVVNLGERLGLTAGEAAVLNAQARIAGVGVDAFGGLVRKLSTDLTDGGDASRQVIRELEAVGVTVGAAGGKFRDPIDILRDFATRLDELPSHAAKVDLLSKAFGRGAIELLPLIEHFKQLENQARSTGVGLDNDLLKRMTVVDDKLDVLGISFDRLKLKLSERLVAGVEGAIAGFNAAKDAINGVLGPLSGIAIKGLAAAAAVRILIGTGALGSLPGVLGTVGGALSRIGVVGLEAFVNFPGKIPGVRALVVGLAEQLLRIPAALKVISAFDFAGVAAGFANMAKAAAAAGTVGLGASISNIIFAIRGGGGLIGALTLGETAILALGQAALIAGAAFAGWKLGAFLRENVPALKAFGDAIADMIDKIPGVESVINRMAGVRSVVAPTKDLAAGIKAVTDSLTKQGATFEGQGSRTLTQYAAYLVAVQNQLRQVSGVGQTTANKLVDNFNRGGDSVESLQRHLQDLTKESDRVQATIVKSNAPESDKETAIIQGRIDKFHQLGREIDATKKRIKDLGEQEGAEQSAHGLLLQSQSQEQLGLGKIYDLKQKALEQFGKTKKAISDITQAFANQFKTETATLERQALDQKNALDILQVGFAKAQQLRQLSQDTVGGAPTQGAEQARVQIELAAIDKISALERGAIVRRETEELASLQREADKGLVTKDVFERGKAAVEQKYRLELDKADAQSDDARNQARSDAAVKTEQIILQRTEDVYKQRSGIVEEALSAERDTQLRGLEAINATTVAQKIAVEERRAQIEIDYLGKLEAVQEAGIQHNESRELASLKLLLNAKLISEEVFEQDRAAIVQGYDLQIQKLRLTTEAQTNAAREEAAIKSAQIVQAQSQSIFDRFKQESNSILDQTLAHSKNIFQAIGDSLKNAFLTAFKDIISSRVAAQLTELVTGEKVSLVNEQRGQGPLGRLAGAIGLGATPVFGGGKSKLEGPNHLGDLTLVSSNGALAVPVVIQGLNSQAVRQPQNAPSAAAAGGGIGTGLLSLLSGLARGGGGSAAPQNAAVSEVIHFAADEGATTVEIPSAAVPATATGSSAPGGIFGSLQNLLGFGGGSGSNPFSIPGLNVNAGGFETAAGAPAQASAGGGLFQAGGLLGNFKGLLSGGKNFLSDLGNIGFDKGGLPGVDGAPGVDLGTQGIGGAAGGALLAGGGILAYDGLRRGGVKGLLETTAGGAAIGAKFGGPIGAAIGAGVGALAGFVRLFIKGKAEKIQERVKALYNITISKPFAQELQKTIDANYGGDIDRGLHSTELLDKIQLYAQSTGQNFPLANKPYAVGLSLQGGQVYQTAATVDGSTVAYGGGTAKLQSPVDKLILGQQIGGVEIQGGKDRPQVNQPTQLIVQNLQLGINGDSALAALRGEIASSPQQVADAQLAATKSSINRREIAVAQTTPGLLLQ